VKYRPSKFFVIAMAALCPVLVALIFGLLPELDAMKKPKVPGELSFPARRPLPVRNPDQGAVKARPMMEGWSLDWLDENYEKLMTWDKNPWKRPRPGLGGHFARLKASKNPLDQEKARLIERTADAIYQQLLKRYPELAVEMRNIPPGQNGFLKFLELQERYNKPGQSFSAALPVPIPESLAKHLQGEAWNSGDARSWLDSQRGLIDEIRSIGRLPERSVAGIDLERWFFMPARFAKGCADALLLDARLAAEDGDTERALASVKAAVGLADHHGNVETPSLLHTTVQILVRLGVQRYTLMEIMPHLPPGQTDVSAWRDVVNPVAKEPGDFARVMTGEWHVVSRYWLLRPIADPEDPKYPSDPEALLDAYSEPFVEIVSTHRGQPLPRLPELEMPNGPPDLSHLSRDSRETMENLWVGARAWRKGWDRAQSVTAMTQAAFSIMQGQPVPNDPVYGLPYRWDADSRTLSAPDSSAFKELDIKPLTLPKP